jgi:endonuclease/exonuclease/phosphatase family metal-dependent hydrolase
MTALVLLLTCGVLQAAPENLDLGVMTFNVRYGSAKDGDNAWEKRRDLLCETIQRSDPDILGVQECLDFQAEFIAESLPDYAWLGLGREKDGKGEMTAIFYKKEALVPIEYGNFWLSETPDIPGSKSWDTSLTRIATWIRFYHPATKTFFHHLNTHFDHRGREARAQSARVVAERLAPLGGDYPILVTGDFNAVGGSSQPWKNFKSAGFRDAWLEAEEREGPVTTWSGFTMPDLKSDRRIDWVLARGSVKILRCASLDFNENGRFPSDHLPVFCRVSISQNVK